MKRFRGGLVFKALRLLHHSRVIKRKKVTATAAEKVSGAQSSHADDPALVLYVPGLEGVGLRAKDSGLKGEG